MERSEKNRQHILKYYKSVSGAKKTPKTVSRFISDPALIERVLYFEKLLPAYEMIPDEITCEDDRVIVRARVRGKHTGEAEDIPPTFKTIEMPFVIGYRLERGKIIDHWLIADQMELLEQLGLASPA